MPNLPPLLRSAPARPRHHLGRALALLALAFAPCAAWAQSSVPPQEPMLPPPPPGATDPVAAPPPAPAPPSYLSRVRGHKPSPEWTQDRNFGSTRVWLYDPGTVTLETWWITRTYSDARDNNSYRFYQEVAVGVAPHLQLDLYAEFRMDSQDDVVDPNRSAYYPSVKGLRAEARIAIPDSYGTMALNPVIYLEYMAFVDEPTRFEIRLLLSGQPTRWLFLAANPYFEFNISKSDKWFGTDSMGADITKSLYLMDAEIGTTLAAGFRITDWFNLSIQAKIGGDMLGDTSNKLHFVAWAGPGFLIKPLPRPFENYLKIIGTWLIRLPGSDTNGQDFGDHTCVTAGGDQSSCYGRPQLFEPTLILSTSFN